MIYFLSLIFIVIFLFFSVILAMPYKVHLVLSFITFFILKNPILSFIFLILALIRYNGRNNFNTEFKFKTNRKINEEEFYEYFNNYNNTNTDFNSHKLYENEYENACNELGIDSSISYEDKKKIYKKLLLKYHPDVNNTSEALEMSQKINKCWDIIEKYEKNKN